MNAQQPSRLAVAGRFFFYTAVAPLLLAVAFVGVVVLLKAFGIIGIDG